MEFKRFLSFLLFLNSLLSIIMFILIMLYASISFASGVQLILLILPILTSLYYLNEYVEKGTLYPKLNRKFNILLLFFLAILPLFIGVYFYFEYFTIIYLAWYEFSYLDLAFATFILLLVMEFSRRKHPILFWINVFFFVYCLPQFGKLLPEPFYHLGLPYLRIITSNTIEGSGIFGSLPLIGFYYVIPMLIFLGIITSFGALHSLIDIISAYVKRKRALPPVCILTSAAIGVTTASITANVTVAGSFTIPTYKKLGFPPDYAASIEVASSIGGLILPPIMSVVAFVMAGIIGVTYWEVVTRAWIIGFIYFATLIICVDLIARKFILLSNQSAHALVDVSEERRPIDKKVFLYFGAFLLSLVVIIFYLGVLMFEIPVAAYYGLITLSIYLLIVKIYEGTKQGFKSSLVDYLKCFLEGIREGVVDSSNIILLVATMGIMLNVMTATGFLMDLSWVLVKLAEVSPLLLVVTAYIFGIAVGLGLPPTSTYISLAILFVPIMVKCGFDFWAAHFFAFLVACLAEFSPPASIASAAAAEIAKGSFYKIMIISSFIALPIWLFPFACVLYPQIVTLTLEGGLMGFIVLSAFLGLTVRFILLKAKMDSLSSIMLSLNVILGIIAFLPLGIIIQLISAILIWIFLIITSRRPERKPLSSSQLKS